MALALNNPQRWDAIKQKKNYLCIYSYSFSYSYNDDDDIYLVGWLVEFYSISTLVGYLIAKSIFIQIIISISNNSV